MHKITAPESYTICKFDGINASAVYIGSMSCLTQANDKLVWREDSEMGEWCYSPFYVLTLEEIKDQLTNAYGGTPPSITVVVESPLHGHILQYGNYGDEWWQIGELSGYA